MNLRQWWREQNWIDKITERPLSFPWAENKLDEMEEAHKEMEKETITN